MAILTIALILSCKKSYHVQDTIFNKPTTFPSKTEAKTYINTQLQTYAAIFTELAKDPEIRYLVHQNIAKQFDGDNNVLTKDLIVDAESKGIRLKEKFSQILQKTKYKITIDQLLNSLNDINNKNIFLQIYIPNFEKFNLLKNESLNTYKNKNIHIQNVALEYPNPIMVPYDGDETVLQDYYTGYTYTDNDIMEEVTDVNEEFAEEHEIWILTPNETVNNDGLVVAPPGYDNTNLAPTSDRPDLFFPNMTIKEHKESWIKGANEICMFAGITWDNGINPSTGQYQTSFRTEPSLISLPDRNNDVNNIYIRDFRRKEIKNKTNVGINFTYFPLSTEVYYKEDPCSNIWLRSDKTAQQNVIDYNACKLQNPNILHYFFPERGDYLYYTIYEYDTGFFGLNGYEAVQVSGNGYTQNIYYRSNESPYISGRLKILPKNQPTQAYENTGWANINNNSISFNSRHR